MTGAIHHVDLTVGDLAGATFFYDRVLPLLGFRRVADGPAGEPVWAGQRVEIGLQRSRSPQPHDRYAPGLHHLAFAAPDRAAVERVHQALRDFGIEILDPPADYPQYGNGYFALFFVGPDGVKLEYVFTPAASA